MQNERTLFERPSGIQTITVPAQVVSNANMLVINAVRDQKEVACKEPYLLTIKGGAPANVNLISDGATVTGLYHIKRITFTGVAADINNLSLQYSVKDINGVQDAVQRTYPLVNYNVYQDQIGNKQVLNTDIIIPTLNPSFFGLLVLVRIVSTANMSAPVNVTVEFDFYPFS